MKATAVQISLIVLFLFSAASLAGQTPTVYTAAGIANAGASGNGSYMPLAAGAPFRAKVVSTSTRLLPDGTTVSQKFYSMAARDNTGKMYREERGVLAANSDMEPPLVLTIVYDPKTGLSTTCTASRRTCRLAVMPTNAKLDEEPTGLSADGNSTLTREDLGWKKIGELDAQGARETKLYRAGSLGNDKPLVVTREYWYSPRLQIILQMTKKDPRSGTQTSEVTEMKLGEPGAEWFAVPIGYRVLEERTATEAGMAGRSRVGPHSLEQVIEKMVNGMTPEQLTAGVKPVDAAVDAYALAHAAASPNDKNEYFADQVRQRLGMDLRMLQQMRMPTRDNFEEMDLRMNQAFRAVIESQCLNKPIPGDPPNVPASAETLRAEQAAWLKMRDAWSSFLESLFPASEHAGFGMTLTSQRQSELRRLEVVEKNRGCAVLE
jgi:uncharacterized protein YecT (DUF1311 family)